MQVWATLSNSGATLGQRWDASIGELLALLYLRCESEDDVHSDQLHFDNVAGVFIILGIFLAAAVATFLLQQCIGMSMKSKRKKGKRVRRSMKLAAKIAEVGAPADQTNRPAKRTAFTGRNLSSISAVDATVIDLES